MVLIFNSAAMQHHKKKICDGNGGNIKDNMVLTTAMATRQQQVSGSG
jgi:hypothetical protein